MTCHGLSYFIVQFQKISIPTLWKVIRNSEGVGKFRCVEASNQKSSVGWVWIFSGTAHWVKWRKLIEFSTYWDTKTGTTSWQIKASVYSVIESHGLALYPGKVCCSFQKCLKYSEPWVDWKFWGQEWTWVRVVSKLKLG